MITNYNEFVNESTNGSTPESVYGISKYEVRENGKLDVYEDVIITRTFAELPYEFGVVKGNFRILKCPNLTTLKGCPEKVIGHMVINENPSLTDLNYCTKIVTESFACCRNKNITSIEDGPYEVGSYYYLTDNILLTSLKGAPQKLPSHFNISGLKKLESLDYFPKEIMGNVDLYGIKFLKKKNVYINLDNYPVSIIHGNIRSAPPLFIFAHDTIIENIDRFRSLMDNKVKFHQEVMRLVPGLIQYYSKKIQRPTRKTII